MVFNLCEENSVANQFMAELRDKSIQGDRMKFRKNLERLGQIMAYEISRKLSFQPVDVDTPLGKTSINVPVANPVLITVNACGVRLLSRFR
ncbi:MAG: uracil phosphoribosyltransferase [Chryseolinea sp.]